jgi:hypothetical protein
VLHQAIGPNYKQVLVQPGIGSLTREVIAGYTAEQVYSTARQEIQDKIRSLVEERLSEKMMEHAGEEGEESYHVAMSSVLILYDILVTGIELPAAIVTAINRKTEQYYIAEEYKFRVEREKRESERKKIEAEGIRDFQQTVSQGISDSYLRWRGIEATLQLSQSTNAKTVIIGNGKDGLPVIRGAPAPPAGNTTHGDDKERTTAASPARSTRPLRGQLSTRGLRPPPPPESTTSDRQRCHPLQYFVGFDRRAQRIQFLGQSFHLSAQDRLRYWHLQMSPTLFATRIPHRRLSCAPVSAFAGPPEAPSRSSAQRLRLP